MTLEYPAAETRRLIRDSYASEPDAPPAPLQACTAARTTATSPNSGLDWIEIVLVDQAGHPAADVAWRVTTSNGVVYEGTLDETGTARLDGIMPGDAVVTFPELDRRLWDTA